jgi:hypothetical protein
MVNLVDLIGKAIALVVWNTEKEDDVHVYLGKLQMERDEYYFLNEEKGWQLSLSEEQLSDIHTVPGELKTTLLNADYALSMAMSDLPESDSEDFKPTGMKWHN